MTESPLFSAMVVDASTGRTLFSNHEDALRHPASLTKVMTLYLLFEKLKAGEMRLDERIGVSAHAASMAPTKLGLRPGSTIAIEDAIKAIVTKSANDMAVAVAEAIGGSEADFAAMMTHKAHTIGMSRTQYVNASGLPDDRQLTTARDLTVLGRSIRENFPSYYHFFSIPSFTYAGSFMPNHNHLLGRIDGMDGIKTGYTRASGFNLLTSVNRDGHHLVSVVLGGRTAASRDRVMASLIEDHIEEAAPTRSAERPAPSPLEAPAQTVQDAGVDPQDDAEPAKERGPSLIAPTLAVPAAPVVRPNDRAKTVGQTVTGSIPFPVDRPRPAFIAGTPRIDHADRAPNERRHLALDGSTSAHSAQSDTAVEGAATATPSSLRWVAGPAGAPGASPAPALRTAAAEPPKRPERAEPATTRAKAEAMQERDLKDRAAPGGQHGEWVIQIGATDAADKATDLLTRAKVEGRSALGAARPFTEKVKKGDSTLYRARFAGLEPQEAEAACKALKRSGFACFATKD